MPDTQEAVQHKDPVVARKKHFLRKRKYAQQFLDAGLDNEASNLFDCQETEILAACSNCGHSWYVVAKCRSRICPLCSYETSKRRSQYLVALTSHMKHPKLMTLTMPRWKTTPKEGIHFLRHSFLKLRRSKYFKGVRGGAYQIELKHKEDGWHIHMHVLFDGPYIPRTIIFAAWRRLIDVRVPQVDIRAAGDRKAIEYVCKYAAKSAAFDSPAGDIVAWYIATKGERLFATFGEWYNATLNELDPDLAAEPHAPACPHCNSEKTIYLARDGPYVYGYEDWRKLESTVTRGREYSRPLAHVKQVLDGDTPCNPETPQTSTTMPFSGFGE